MEQLLARIPKFWLLVGALVLAIVFVFILNPPHSPCDSQKQLFLKAHGDTLKLRTRDDDVQSSRLAVQLARCKTENSAGGCESYLRQLRKIMVDLRNVPEECTAKMGEDAQLKTSLKEALRLMTQIAWGFEPPLSSFERLGWFEPQDIVLFCQLRNYYTGMTSAVALKEILQELKLQLPEASELEFDEVWRRSLLSLDCSPFKS